MKGGERTLTCWKKARQEGTLSSVPEKDLLEGEGGKRSPWNEKSEVHLMKEGHGSGGKKVQKQRFKRVQDNSAGKGQKIKGKEETHKGREAQRIEKGPGPWNTKKAKVNEGGRRGRNPERGGSN